MEKDRVLLVCQGSIDPKFRPYRPLEWLGPAERSLSSYDIVRAMRLGVRLRSEFGLKPEHKPIAVSESSAARQTARYAEFGDLVVDPRLNPLDLGDPLRRTDVLRGRQLPASVLEAIERILDEPPEADIWVMDASFVGAIYKARQAHALLPYRITPDPCDIWPLDL